MDGKEHTTSRLCLLFTLILCKMQVTSDSRATIPSTTITVVKALTIPVSGTECANGDEEWTAVSVGAGTAVVGEPLVASCCEGVADIVCWMMELFTGCMVAGTVAS